VGEVRTLGQAELPSVSSAVRSGLGATARRSAVGRSPVRSAPATGCRTGRRSRRRARGGDARPASSRWARDRPSAVTSPAEGWSSAAARREACSCRYPRTDDRDQLAASTRRSRPRSATVAGRSRLVDLEDVVELERRPVDLLAGFRARRRGSGAGCRLAPRPPTPVVNSLKLSIIFRYAVYVVTPTGVAS